MRYEDFLASKFACTPTPGITDVAIDRALFPHQRDLVAWALRRGRAAIFADTGLGKSLVGLEWAAHVCEHAGRVLVLTPLAVADQWVREGERFGIRCAYRREDNGDHNDDIVITNYEMLDRFNPLNFAGVVLDESSILKAYDGKTRTAIIRAFASTPYRLALTATPSPNDHTELGNHAEFLGVKHRVEMLAEYFVHDGGSTQKWRLKGHAEDVFWRWVCTWAAMVRKPSDLGYSDDRYDLPPLRHHEHVIPIEHRDAWSEGFLFAPEARTLAEQRATRRATLAARVAKAAELADGDEQCLVWCELNAESEACARAIPGAVEVKGSDSLEDKRERLLGFADGDVRVLVTKPSIAGFGMNWQSCARMVFVGASHSFEQTYQAIRRCWRFGQERPVDVHVIRSETEGAIVANFERKRAAHAEMMNAMAAHMRDIMRAEVQGTAREWNSYVPNQKMWVPEWLKEVA